MTAREWVSSSESRPATSTSSWNSARFVAAYARNMSSQADQRLPRLRVLGAARRSVSEVVDLVAVDRLEQGEPGGEVAVERADADARALGDLSSDVSALVLTEGVARAASTSWS